MCSRISGVTVYFIRLFFFFKQKTAYEMRISDWSSDVCSSDLLLSMFFTDLQVHHLGVTVLVITLTASIFALGGFINAVFARNFDDISIIPTFVLTPLTYLGGVFYSINLQIGRAHV